MSYLRYFIIFYLIITLLCCKANSSKIALRCLVFLGEHDTSSQSVSVIEVPDNKYVYVDRIKSEIKKKWPSLQKYNPDQIALRRMTDRITAKKLITNYYNDKIERGIEMLPVDMISTYFQDNSSLDCENCIDIAVYLRVVEEREEL